MTLILTYHRVVRQRGDSADFYTVLAEQFERQLAALREAQLPALPPEQLLTPRPFPPGYFLSFDDGTVDHVEVVLPILMRNRCRAIFFISTAKVGRPGHVGVAELGLLKQSGQVIGLHGHEHRRLDVLPRPELETQLVTCRAQMAEWTGEETRFFAPPGGYTSHLVRDVAAQIGVQALRTMRWGYNRRFDLMDLECQPLNSGTGAAQFQRIIAGKNRSWLYGAKEAVKAVLPIRLYVRLRNLAAGASSRN